MSEPDYKAVKANWNPATSHGQVIHILCERAEQAERDVRDMTTLLAATHKERERTDEEIARLRAENEAMRGHLQHAINVVTHVSGFYLTTRVWKDYLASLTPPAAAPTTTREETR